MCVCARVCVVFYLRSRPPLMRAFDLSRFLNFLVYRRPRYMRHRHRDPDLSRLDALNKTLRWSFLGAPKTKKPAQNVTHHRDDTREPVPVEGGAIIGSPNAVMHTIEEVSKEYSRDLSNRGQGSHHPTSTRSAPVRRGASTDEFSNHAYKDSTSLHTNQSAMVYLNDDVYDDANWNESGFVTFERYSSYSRFDCADLQAPDDVIEEESNAVGSSDASESNDEQKAPAEEWCTVDTESEDIVDGNQADKDQSSLPQIP